MKAYAIVIITLASFAFAEDAEKPFLTSGTQGIRLWCDTTEKLKYMQTFQNNAAYDFLRLSSNTSAPAEVIVTGDQVASFKADLEAHQIKYEVVVKDMKQLIEDDLKEITKLREKRSNDDILSTFPRYDEIKDYLMNLAMTHSNVMKCYSIGKSYENRDILAVHLSIGEKKKKALLIDAGIHAREWIAPTTAIHIIKEIVLNENNWRMLKNVDIYVIPLLNPDGYEYSHQGGETRLWRKTRSRQTNTTCVGVDANRNFEYKWSPDNDPCGQIYSGPRPFSESEAAALRDFLFLNKNIKIYLSLHSFGNFLLYPWGYTEDKAPNYRLHKCLANKAVEALFETRGTYYETGSVATTLYTCTGSSQDWALHETSAKLSFTMELPSTAFHFAPPANLIAPIGQETFEAVKIFVTNLEGTGPCTLHW